MDVVVHDVQIKNMTLKETELLANELMLKHELKGYLFTFDNARRRFGCCNYKLRQITLSKHLTLLNSEDKVRDTILHEIAHALVGPAHGHDRVWKIKAIQIGCDGRRCYGKEVERVKPKYKGECKNCHRFIFRHKRTKISCGLCSKFYNPEHIFIWTIN
jgi:predicted SprT family Zn-dependent metalloprotease